MRSKSTINLARLGCLVFGLTTMILAWLEYRHFVSPPEAYEVSTKAPSARPQSRFAILCMTTSETTYDYISISNKHMYAEKHGYDLIWDFTPARRYSKVWDKLNISRDAIETSLYGDKAYEWVWMLDFDTLVTNTSITLSDIVEQGLSMAEEEGKAREDVNLILARDCDLLNAGSLFLRVSPWTLDFIKQWRAGEGVPDDQGRPRNEQEVLRDMLFRNDSSVLERSVIATQQIFDAYPPEIECYDPRNPVPWSPGMFLVHFAGAKWKLQHMKDPVGTLMRRYYWAVD